LPAAQSERNIFVDTRSHNSSVVVMNSGQAKRYLARKGATFAPGKGGHLIVTSNGKRFVLPQHGGSKETGRGLWQAILKQLEIKD
jgi:mRNA interferase HicA